MEASLKLNPHLTSEIVISDAWFGAWEAGGNVYGLFVRFTKDGRNFIHQIYGMQITHGPTNIDFRNKNAASLFLNVARLVHENKIRSVDELKGRRAVVEIFGGFTITHFELLKT